MADLQRPKKYGRPAYNPARFPEHHLLYKELIPYFDFLHNIGFNNLPGQLNLPQPGFNLPISSSHSHRAIFTPLDLRYVAGSASAPSVSSSGHRGTYTNVSNVNAVSNSDVGVNRTGPAERDLLPSDALRNLYRLAERVYSHLDVVLDGKNHQRTGLQGQNGNTRNDKSIENAARPAARDGSIHAPGGYSTESQRDVESSRSFGGRDPREPSISDSVSSLYSQNTLATSTLLDENDSFYGAVHDRDLSGTKLAALSAAFEKAQNQLAYERSTREEAESVIGALRGEVGLLTGRLERADSELAAARERERELLAQYKALNASIHGLKSQLVDSEPAWAAALRAEVLASVNGLSSTTTHSFTGISKDLKHQHQEITQLGERTSKLAASHETVVREATHGVQQHLSGKLQHMTTEINKGHKESMSALSSLEITIKNEFPPLSSAVTEVKSAVDCVEENLGKYELSSNDKHAELKQILHQGTTASLTNHTHTGKLIHGVDEKLNSLSSTTTHSLTGITKDLKHQHNEITHLGERTSKLAASQEAVVRETTHGVQLHLSGKLHNVATEITKEHKESMTAISSLGTTVKKELSPLSTVIIEVKSGVDAVERNLGKYEASSNDKHAELKQILEQSTAASLTNHTHTSKLVRGLDDKLQQHIATSTEVAYANVAAQSKTTSKSDNEEVHAGSVVVALESLKALISGSLATIQQTIERQQTDVTSLVAHVSSQTSHQEALSKTGESTSVLLKNLDNKLSHSEAGHSEVLTALRAMQESLASISASTWFEQGVENCGLSKKDDIVSITNTLKHVSSQLHNLSGDGDASPLTLADLMTQLSDLNTRLATLEEEVQGVATAAVVVEEISTIKSVRSLEHQADMAAGERMREAVLGLDEFVRGQLDQVNAALDEQQSRLVSIQTIGKQQVEDSKAISLIVEENGELLRGIESQGTQARGASTESINGVNVVLEEIKEHVAALRESDSTRIQTLADAPPPMNDDIKELCKSMKEHHDLLDNLPQRIRTDSAERHDTLLARNVEVVALLTALSTTLAQLSKETHELKNTVTKVDSSLTESHTASTESSKVSEREISSVAQTITALQTEILAIRERLFSLPLPTSTPDAASSEQSAALLAKLDAILADLTGTKTALGGDIADGRAQSESQTQRLAASLAELRVALDSLGSTSDQGVASLRSVIEKQSTELLAMREQISTSQTSSSTEITSQLSELTALVRGISFAEVLDHLRELGVSFTDIRALISEESKSNTNTSASLVEIQKLLEAYAAQFGQVLKNDEGHTVRHDALVAILDQNQVKISEVYNEVQSHSSSTKELVSENHTSTMSSLEKISSRLDVHETLSKEHCTEIIKVANNSQQYLSERGDKQGSDINAKLSDLSQSFVELLSAHTFSSQSLREGVTQLGDSNSRLNGKVETRFKETVDALNTGFDSLRQEMTKEPAQIKTLLAMLQERIGSVALANEERQQTLTDSLKDDLSSLHKDMEPFKSLVVKSQDNGRLMYLAEERKEGEDHFPGMEDQLHRMEQIQHSLEGFVSNHHCNGCNCRGGYDSSQASPLKQRRNLSQFGSDATGLSPHPYVEQTFEVPSPADVRKEASHIEPLAKPYSLDDAASPEEAVTQSPLATTGSETADKFSFPQPHSRTGSTTGGPTYAADASSIGSAGGSKKEHHHKHHDDREISNPFELFARRPRKSSHKPPEGSDELQESAQRPPLAKPATSTSMRTSIGPGKSQRGSLLSSALLSTVSDNTAPAASVRKRTTSSGGLHRLSSIFGKHHHHHDEETHTTEGSTTVTKEGSTVHEHEHEGSAKGQE